MSWGHWTTTMMRVFLCRRVPSQPRHLLRLRATCQPPVVATQPPRSPKGLEFVLTRKCREKDGFQNQPTSLSSLLTKVLSWEARKKPSPGGRDPQLTTQFSSAPIPIHFHFPITNSLALSASRYESESPLLALARPLIDTLTSPWDLFAQVEFRNPLLKPSRYLSGI